MDCGIEIHLYSATKNSSFLCVKLANHRKLNKINIQINNTYLAIVLHIMKIKQD